MIPIHRAVFVAVGLLALLAPVFVPAVHAAERPTLELVAGLGSASTKWDDPVVRETYGGGAASLRALLTLPVSPVFTALVGFRMSKTDTGWLDGYAQSHLQLDRVTVGEFGFRIRL